MPAPDEARLIEKLRAIEALHARPATAGEKAAAANARERIRKRLLELSRTDAPVEFQFSMTDRWSRRVFTALLRRYGLKPYRYPRQRHTTVMVRVSEGFLNETLWPEYQAIQKTLSAHLDEVTNRVVKEVLHDDLSDATVDTQGQLPLPVSPDATAGANADLEVPSTNAGSVGGSDAKQTGSRAERRKKDRERKKEDKRRRQQKSRSR